MEDKNSSRMWVYPPNCRTKVGARWSPSFPRQSLARRRARNIVQVHAHALNGSWECYHVVRIGLGAIWGDHGRRRSLHFTTRQFCLKKGWVCLFPKNKYIALWHFLEERRKRQPFFRRAEKISAMRRWHLTVEQDDLYCTVYIIVFDGDCTAG